VKSWFGSDLQREALALAEELGMRPLAQRCATRGRELE
jgi:hypothetical protein